MTSILDPHPEDKSLQKSSPASCTEAVRIEREPDGAGWLIIVGDHAWFHGNFSAALSEAREIAASFGVVVLSSAGVP